MTEIRPRRFFYDQKKYLSDSLKHAHAEYLWYVPTDTLVVF